MSALDDRVKDHAYNCQIELGPFDIDEELPCTCHLEEARAELAALRSEREWASVKDRLPADDRDVPVCVPHGWRVACRRNGQWIDTDTAPLFDIELWYDMPLPQPPKGNE